MEEGEQRSRSPDESGGRQGRRARSPWSLMHGMRWLPLSLVLIIFSQLRKKKRAKDPVPEKSGGVISPDGRRVFMFSLQRIED